MVVAVAVGSGVGSALGSAVGSGLASLVGSVVGSVVGSEVVGSEVGWVVGSVLGSPSGSGLGSDLGSLGSVVGSALGEALGLGLGLPGGVALGGVRPGGLGLGLPGGVLLGLSVGVGLAVPPAVAIVVVSDAVLLVGFESFRADTSAVLTSVAAAASCGTVTAIAVVHEPLLAARLGLLQVTVCPATEQVPPPVELTPAIDSGSGTLSTMVTSCAG